MDPKPTDPATSGSREPHPSPDNPFSGQPSELDPLPTEAPRVHATTVTEPDPELFDPPQAISRTRSRGEPTEESEALSAQADERHSSPSTPQRVGAIDAFRGLVLFLMAAEVLRLGQVAAAFPEGSIWHLLAQHQTHAPWQGWTLHDLIQPGFTFLVGVAMPWSIASRVGHGHSLFRMALHTLWRSVLLVGLGVWLRSLGGSSTNFTFEDTLTQIGLGYALVWFLAWGKPWIQGTVLGFILIGYWALFVVWPLPPPDFDPTTVGVPADWPHWMSGFAAHWNKNIHPGQAFDVWFLNLFPRETPFEFNRGGYVTLNFVPTMGTMILGLMAGQWLRNPEVRSGASRVFGLLIGGLIALLLGILLNDFGLCPSVKRIWTPSWVLFSGGCCLLFLAAAYAVIDVARLRFWAVPLIILGANSIFLYLIIHLWGGFLRNNLRIHLGADFWQDQFGALAPVWEGGTILLIYWLCCCWLWRRRVFIRI